MKTDTHIKKGIAFSAIDPVTTAASIEAIRSDVTQAGNDLLPVLVAQRR